MRTIKTSELRPGMRFDRPVYIEGENILVPAEIPIKEKDIERLTRWQIGEVYTEGEQIGEGTIYPQKPVQAGKDNRQDSGLLPPGAEKLLKSYRSTIENVESILQVVNDGTAVNHRHIDAVVNDSVEQLRQQQNALIQLMLMEEPGGSKFALSAVNCMILATVIGITMKLTGHKLLQLATGGLLHDLGMMKIDRQILEKQGKLTETELNQVRTHPVLGYRIIAKELKYPEEIALVALQHHERWDGKGYPRRLKGEDIALESRIVTVVDAYEAMIGQRPYRNSMIGYTAMKGILSDNGKHFDPQVLKAFLESMGVFPIGSVVQLSNAAIGRVAENHPQAPLRPKLELIIDEAGNRLDGKEAVDLLERKSLFIVKAVDPKSR
jgi:HD-GYP domain-containing protein (c-di-GMP phosphodiesterase class II)